MAFSEIDETQPTGTKLVSDVDDAIRETRSWIKNCLKKISGYPDIEAPKLPVYTTATRPGLTEGLIGFNKTTGHLEIGGTSGSVIDITQAGKLASWPVGSYLFTSNSSYDPNSDIGGTWSRDVGDGRCLISAGSGYGLGATGGSATHTMTEAELVNHGHGSWVDIQDHFHYCGLDDGSNGGKWILMGNTGTRNVANLPGGTKVICWNGSGGDSGDRDNTGWNMVTSRMVIEGGSNRYGVGISNTGGTNSFNIMNPYRAVYIWHRTA